MKRIIPTVPFVPSLAMAATASELPAARVGDSMQSGGVIVGPGATTVRIGGAAAARVGDFATDPRNLIHAGKERATATLRSGYRTRGGCRRGESGSDVQREPLRRRSAGERAVLVLCPSYVGLLSRTSRIVKRRGL